MFELLLSLPVVFPGILRLVFFQQRFRLVVEPFCAGELQFVAQLPRPLVVALGIEVFRVEQDRLFIHVRSLERKFDRLADLLGAGHHRGLREQSVASVEIGLGLQLQVGGAQRLVECLFRRLVVAGAVVRVAEVVVSNVRKLQRGLFQQLDGIRVVARLECLQPFPHRRPRSILGVGNRSNKEPHNSAQAEGIATDPHGFSVFQSVFVRVHLWLPFFVGRTAASIRRSSRDMPMNHWKRSFQILAMRDLCSSRWSWAMPCW